MRSLPSCQIAFLRLARLVHAPTCFEINTFFYKYLNQHEKPTATVYQEKNFCSLPVANR